MAASRTPLAWKNLTHDPRRLALACAGIGFAVLLMFVQVGFENALFNSQVKLIDELSGDIFITSKARFALAAEKRFPVEVLNQVRSVEGVASVTPVYTEWTMSVLKNLSPTDDTRAAVARQKGRRIRSIAYPISAPVFKSRAINRQAALLRKPMTALIDSRSKKPSFDFPMQQPAELAAAPAELAGKELQLVGSFDLGADFVHDGNLIMSDRTFARYFPHRQRTGDPLGVVDIGVVRLTKNADARRVQQQIKGLLGVVKLTGDGDQEKGNFNVFTRSNLRLAEMDFWQQNTPIGVVFWAGKVIGFIVGVVICYQVIFSDISDHMAEFATLKAMGYGADYFTRLIVTEGLLLSVMGFIPGAIASWVLYLGLGAKTGLQLVMGPGVLGLVFASTVAMCVVSGLLAVRKLITADPASLF